MTPVNGTASPTLYDQWKSFCNNPSDQIVYKEGTLIVGSDCKTVIRCPADFSGMLVNLVLCGNATLVPDDTNDRHEFHVTNIFVLEGNLECQGVDVIANRVLQLTRPKFMGALSTLFVQGSAFKPIGYRRKETPPLCFKTNVFQIATDTSLEKLHSYKGLRTAAKNGEADYVKLFIAAKANVDEGTQNTPMTLAAERNHAEVVQLLIEANASLEKPEVITGSTPLIFAAANNAVEAAQLLLKAKADVNTTNFARQTPLAVALATSSLEILNLLYAAGVNLDAPSPIANSMSAAVMHAVGNGLVQKLSDLLAQGFNIEATNESDDTPLTLAARYGQDQIVALLLANNADTEVRGSTGTALEVAVYINFPIVIALLIAEDPDSAIKMLMTHPNTETIANLFLQLVPDRIAFGRQALHMAVRSSNANAVRALLAAGIGVSGDPSNRAEKTFGEELLLHAVYTASYEIVRLLIHAKANFHLVDSQGMTLLMQIRLLESGLSLPQGAKLDLRPKRFSTRSGNYKKMIDLLIAAGAEDGLEAIAVKKSSASPKPQKSVQYAAELSTTETVDFASVASAKNNTDAYMALTEINTLMEERNYGYSCSERLLLIETIKNNRKINIEDPKIISALSNLKCTNNNLLKKDQLQSGPRKKPITQDQKDYNL